MLRYGGQALLEHVREGDLMVFNNTRVIPARVYGRKLPSNNPGASAVGGKVEVLIERVVNANTALAHVKASRAPKAGEQLYLGEHEHQQHLVEVTGRQGKLFELKLVDAASPTMLEVLEDIGHMPLPPYIKRPDVEADRESYQVGWMCRLSRVAVFFNRRMPLITVGI